MLKIGLTGGIASGKTLVSDQFTKLGAKVIDADVVAREVIKPGSDALKQIHARFGDDILNPDGSLNRKQLRHTIFTETDDRRWLEQLLHPLIRDQMAAEISASQAPYCILVIPLLIENLPNSLVDRILVVDCDEQQQIDRLMARDHISEPQAEAILNAQISRSERLAAADDIIHNNQTPDNLAAQIAALDRQYREG